MPERRERVLDAAIEIVGGRGLRALTHRAVDTGAALPAGSTSNLFRTRASLVAGVLDRLLDREIATWSAAPPTSSGDGSTAPGGSGIDGAVAALAGRVRLLTGPLRALTVTRFALYHEAALEPGLARVVARSRVRVEGRVRERLAGLGLRLEPEEVGVLLSAMNGLLVERVSTAGQDEVDPAPAVRRVLLGLVAGRGG